MAALKAIPDLYNSLHEVISRILEHAECDLQIENLDPQVRDKILTTARFELKTAAEGWQHADKENDVRMDLRCMMQIGVQALKDLDDAYAAHLESGRARIRNSTDP
jgi:hypothetical protein